MNHCLYDLFMISGSEEERAAARRAFRRSTRREHQVYDVTPPDVTFDLETPEEVKLGDDFEVRIGTFAT